jgi:hypothetical protein
VQCAAQLTLLPLWHLHGWTWQSRVANVSQHMQAHKGCTMSACCLLRKNRRALQTVMWQQPVHETDLKLWYFFERGMQVHHVKSGELQSC